MFERGRGSSRLSHDTNGQMTLQARTEQACAATQLPIRITGAAVARRERGDLLL